MPHPHQKDNRHLGNRTMAIVMEMAKTRLVPYTAFTVCVLHGRHSPLCAKNLVHSRLQSSQQPSELHSERTRCCTSSSNPPHSQQHTGRIAPPSTSTTDGILRQIRTFHLYSRSLCWAKRGHLLQSNRPEQATDIVGRQPASEYQDKSLPKGTAGTCHR